MKPEVSQIWTTKPSNQLVLLTVVEEGALRAIPISTRWEFAGMEDLIVNEEENPLGFKCIFQLWCEFPLLEESLNRFLGEVSPELFDKVQTLLSWLDGNEVEHEYLGTYVEYEVETPWITIPVIHWSFKDPVNGKFHRVVLGQRIRLENDVRNEFRKMVLENIEYLTTPVFEQISQEESWDGE